MSATIEQYKERGYKEKFLANHPDYHKKYAAEHKDKIATASNRYYHKNQLKALQQVLCRCEVCLTVVPLNDFLCDGCVDGYWTKRACAY